MKKFAGGVIILHMCTKNHNPIIWCMVPEIQSETDKKICHFLPFFALLPPPTLMILNIKILKKMEKKCLEILSFYINHMCTINEDHMIHGSWNIRSNRQKFSTFWVIFCPFSPLTTWKLNILILKKTPGDIIILHICTTNDNHMIYGSWDIECERHNFLSFWTVFCPFTSLWTQKIKTLKKMEKIPDNIIILQR